MTVSWGTFAPDTVISLRRLQTLGLSAAVRHYNERSVPGLGGLWFGMPVAWSLLGISIAEELDLQPLPCANAVEASVMPRAIRDGSDRARGRRKLAGLTDLTFADLARRGTYITQPYRMGTVEPLFRLGFVKGAGQRFNLYRLSLEGERFLEPLKRERAQLLGWAKGAQFRSSPRLAPDQALPADCARLAMRQLRDYSEAEYRRALLDIGPEIFGRSPLEREKTPSGLEPAHWADIRSGVALVRLRDAAIAVLAAIETALCSGNRAPVSQDDAAASSAMKLEQLSAAASVMLSLDDSSPGSMGHVFARMCAGTPASVVTELARLDGTVIRLFPDGRIGLGPAGGEPSEVDDDGDLDRASVPVSIVPELPRLANLYSLAGDLERNLS